LNKFLARRFISVNPKVYFFVYTGHLSFNFEALYVKSRKSKVKSNNFFKVSNTGLPLIIHHVKHLVSRCILPLQSYFQHDNISSFADYHAKRMKDGGRTNAPPVPHMRYGTVAISSANSAGNHFNIHIEGAEDVRS
jgi:hypothetical protein